MDQSGSTHTGRRIAIIGGGPGGMAAGIKLLAAGYDDFVIIEKSGGVGGTWYNTRYPGLTCDVKSHLYSFTFEPNPNWGRAYAAQPEILAYMEMVADKYGLAPHLKLNTRVSAARWDEGRAEWTLTTAQGEEIVANVVISAQGMFNELNWPSIDGLHDFKGEIFHAGDWDAGRSLRDKRVAVIGSAASAVQFVPEIAADTRQLFVFQRSAPWIAPKDDPVVEEAQRKRLAGNPIATTEARDAIYADLDRFITFSDADLLASATQAGLRNLQNVEDPELRAKLTPHVPFGCLRPLISNDYYPTFNRGDVDLVTDPIARIVADGVITGDDQLRRVDTIICATGYHVRKFLSAIDVTGRGGRTIEEAWKDGAEAYLGVVTAGFPNMFMMYGPNTNNGSIIFMLETQADLIVDRLQAMDRDGLAWADVRPEVQRAYNEALQVDLGNVEVWQAACSNYYRTPEGKIVTQWPHTMTEYEKRCRLVDDGAFESDRDVGASLTNR